MALQSIGGKTHRSKFNIKFYHIVENNIEKIFNCFFSQIYSAIAESEKREIKNLVLCESFKEPIPQIAIQMAVLIGNISRHDYPQDWNEVTFKYTYI